MKSKRIVIMILCLIIIFVGYLYWGNNSLTVSRYTVSPKDLPESFSGYRIAQISDLHNKDFGGRLARQVELTEPDIIVITGDIIDSYSPNVTVAVEFVEEMAEIAPVYFVTGNHENRLPEEFRSLREKMEEIGITVLDGKTVILEKDGETICLSGIDDLTFFGSSVLGENEILFNEALSSLAEQAKGTVSILLSHRPELIDLYEKNGFDIVFSGHAHGGQIRLPFIGGIFSPAQGFFPEYTSGVYEKGETSMIVSRGIGNSLFPFRIGNRPEIVVCELE